MAAAVPRETPPVSVRQLSVAPPASQVEASVCSPRNRTGPVPSQRPGTEAAGSGGFAAVSVPTHKCSRSLTPQPSRWSPGPGVASTGRWWPAPGLEGTVVPQALPQVSLCHLLCPVPRTESRPLSIRVVTVWERGVNE